MNKKPIDWVAATFLVSYQVLLLVGLPFYFLASRPSGALLGITGVLLLISGLSITAGYHRYFSHRSYKTSPIIETILLFCGCITFQSSALRWSNDHRIHHAYVDTDKDPYSINKGFWFAHFGWMMHKQDPIDMKLVSDLAKNPRVMFQHRFIAPLMFGSNILVWALVGWALNDYLGAFVIAVVLRMFISHHLTWFINSLAHTWGDRPFCQEQTAVNNFILSVLTWGEGYHNYHHVFANDYRNGVRWYHFDPTKWLIWTLSKLGWASELRSIDALTVKKRVVLKRKSLLLKKLSDACSIKKDELEKIIQETSARMIATITNYKELREKLRKEKGAEKEVKAEIKAEIKELRFSFKQDWKQWRLLSKQILA